MQQLSTSDYTILAIVAFYLLRGALNGFLKSLFDMLAGVVAVAAAYFLCQPLAKAVFIPGISLETRSVIAAILLALVVYILMRWLGAVLRKGAELTMFGGIDRIIGAMFGIIQGCAFVLVIFIVGTISPNSEKFVSWTKQGRISPHFAKISEPLAKKTKELSHQAVQELLNKLFQWGVPAQFIQKVSEDPELMKEMYEQGKNKTPPQQRPFTQPDVYTKLFAITSNDTLTIKEKATQLWKVITSSQPPKEPPRR